MDNEQTQSTPQAETIAVHGDGRRFRGWRFGCLRKERGLSLQDVADKLKLSKSKVYAFERGKQDLPVKKFEKLQKWFEYSPAEVQADAEARSREVALASLPLTGLPGTPASVLPPWMKPENGAAWNDRLIREHGSIENYLRHSAELQAKDQTIYDLQMKIWELQAQLAQRDQRDEKIKKTINSAFYGEG